MREVQLRFTPEEVFIALRWIRNRVNYNEFMRIMFPDTPKDRFMDDYHLNKWMIFRDDLLAFWCESDLQRREMLERMIIFAVEGTPLDLLGDEEMYCESCDSLDGDCECEEE